MTPLPLKLVFLGLSLSSSWGNGHATTYRALLKGLARRGHDVIFLERDVPWYAANRDLPAADFCRLAFYDGLDDLVRRHDRTIAEADAVIVGSYVPDGAAVLGQVLARATGLVCFYDIDTPVTLAKLERGDCDYLATDLIPALDIYFSFSGGPVLRDLEERHGARRAVALHCMVDPELYPPTPAEPCWDLGYLGTYSSDRQPALDALLIEPARALPDRRFVVAGPQYPDDIDWPANVDRIDHVPPAEHPAFYGRLRYALNITRADMMRTGWSPSVRLFEAAACGTPIVTDRWTGLDSFFPEGEAIHVADDGRDVIALLERATAADRQAVAARARATVLDRHTGAHRATALEGAIRKAAQRTHAVGSKGAAFAMTQRQQPHIRAVEDIPPPSRKPAMPRRRSVPGAIVAGGAGFLGSHLCERLIGDGYRVYCMDNFYTGLRENLAHLMDEPRFVPMEHDVRNPTPAFTDVVEIYNLACPASPPHYQRSPILTATTSFKGTLRLLELTRKLGCRFVLTSTSEVYGDPEVHPQSESYRGAVSTVGPRACYDESKRMAEALCYDFVRMYDVDVRVARIFNTYGPRMRLDDGRIISNLVSQALRGDALTIYGTGEQTRSFCYVSDMVEGLVRLMRAPGRVEGPVNLGSPEEYTILQVARLVSRLVGRDVDIVHAPLPVDDPHRRRPDIGLAAALLDWRPVLPLVQGLRRTIEWFAANDGIVRPPEAADGAVRTAGGAAGLPRAAALPLSRDP